MTAVLSSLEKAARQAWVAWGGYAKHTICTRCGDATYCRSAHNPAGPFVCLGCYDQGHRS